MQNMTLTLRAGTLTVQFDRDGDRHFNRAGIDNWLGKPVIVLFGGYRFHFDLEARIQRIDGFPTRYSWDWLQRTMADDWIYYDMAWEPARLPPPSAIIGEPVWAVNGRTDLPLLHGHGGLQRDATRQALAAFDALIDAIRDGGTGLPPVYEESGGIAAAGDTKRLRDFLGKAATNDREHLRAMAGCLHAIAGEMAVLPPDAIHVDYRLIPIRVMDGCPNACGFCMARGPSPFRIRSEADIDGQLRAVAELYGDDLYNYNSVLLGECDSLLSPCLEYAAHKAFDVLHCGTSFHAGSNLFLFASNRSLCQQPARNFDLLSALPFGHVYINVGWEAATDGALDTLKKRQTAAEVLVGMQTAGHVNRHYANLHISGNFVAADGFEMESIVEAVNRSQYTGQLYLSPLQGGCSPHKALQDLRTIKNASPAVTAHLYTMQRL